MHEKQRLKEKNVIFTKKLNLNIKIYFFNIHKNLSLFISTKLNCTAINKNPRNSQEWAVSSL